MRITTRFMAVLLTAFVLMLCVYAVEITDFSQITDMNGVYELAADATIPSDFSPIGTESAPFRGSLDGKGFSVTGSYSSIFGYTNGAKIRNINVTGAVLVSDTYFGGIVSIADGKTVIENCTFSGGVTVNTNDMYAIGGGIAGLVQKNVQINNCTSYVTLSVTNKPYMLSFGGIAGENKGSISVCTSIGGIIAASDKYKINLGGIAGENSGSITGCVNKAEIGGSVANDAAILYAGGIAGFNNEGDIVRAVNLGNISGEGLSIYPVYIGGIAGMNQNGSIDTAKNTAVLSITRSFAGGIAGFNFGNKTSATIKDVLNAGDIIKSDSVAGGIVSVSAQTEERGSYALIKYALNLSADKAVAVYSGEAFEIYNMGEADGVSNAVTIENMKTDGIPELETHKDFWVNNTEISALPDLLVAGDASKAQIIPSGKGDTGDVAYYLYSPDSSGYAKAFAAVYYNGSRYISMDYIEKTPTETYARLKASDIPEGTTRIKFIAFAKNFGETFKPAMVINAEIEYTK